MKVFSDFVVAGMAFCFIILLSFLIGHKVGRESLTEEANTKIYQALKLGRK
jgi:hypothetical protein